MAEDLAEVFQLDNSDETIESALGRSKKCAYAWQKKYPHIKVLGDENKMIYYFQYLVSS